MYAFATWFEERKLLRLITATQESYLGMQSYEDATALVAQLSSLGIQVAWEPYSAAEWLDTASSDANDEGMDYRTWLRSKVYPVRRRR